MLEDNITDVENTPISVILPVIVSKMSNAFMDKLGWWTLLWLWVITMGAMITVTVLQVKKKDGKVVKDNYNGKEKSSFEHNPKSGLINPPDGGVWDPKALTPRVGLVAPHPVQEEASVVGAHNYDQLPCVPTVEGVPYPHRRLTSSPSSGTSYRYDGELPAGAPLGPLTPCADDSRIIRIIHPINWLYYGLSGLYYIMY